MKKSELRQIVNEEIRNVLREDATPKITFKGDGETGLDSTSIKKLNVKVNTLNGIKQALQHMPLENEIKFIPDAQAKADYMEEFFGGYAEIWKGVLTVDKKQYTIRVVGGNDIDFFEVTAGNNLEED